MCADQGRYEPGNASYASPRLQLVKREGLAERNTCDTCVLTAETTFEPIDGDRPAGRCRRSELVSMGAIGLVCMGFTNMMLGSVWLRAKLFTAGPRAMAPDQTTCSNDCEKHLQAEKLSHAMHGVRQTWYTYEVQDDSRRSAICWQYKTATIPAVDMRIMSVRGCSLVTRAQSSKESLTGRSGRPFRLQYRDSQSTRLRSQWRHDNCVGPNDRSWSMAQRHSRRPPSRHSPRRDRGAPGKRSCLRSRH